MCVPIVHTVGGGGLRSHSLYSLNLPRLLDLLLCFLNWLIPTAPCCTQLTSMALGPAESTLDDCRCCFGADSVSFKAGGILFTGAQCMDCTQHKEQHLRQYLLQHAELHTTQCMAESTVAVHVVLWEKSVAPVID